MPLGVEFRAVARQTVQLKFFTPQLRKVSNRYALMVGRAINDEDWVTISGRAEVGQESAEDHLRDVIQLDAIAKAARSRDGADSREEYR